MCGRLVNLDTVARVLAEYYHLKTDTQLAALDEALSKVPAVSAGGGHGNVPVKDCISRQAAIDIVEFECGEWSGLAKTIAEEIKQLPSAQPERTCVNCGRTANNGGWYADGGTRCPIEEHYALPKDGYCHLWEKRNVTDDDYPERRTDGEIIPE